MGRYIKQEIASGFGILCFKRMILKIQIDRVAGKRTIHPYFDC